jgi:hypothetical protein
VCHFLPLSRSVQVRAVCGTVSSLHASCFCGRQRKGQPRKDATANPRQGRRALRCTRDATGASACLPSRLWHLHGEVGGVSEQLCPNKVSKRAGIIGGHTFAIPIAHKQVFTLEQPATPAQSAHRSQGRYRQEKGQGSRRKSVQWA